MNSPPGPAPAVSMKTLEERYALALESYLAHEDETALSGAYEVGRSALGQGMSPLDLVMLHEAAVERALAHRFPKADRAVRARAAAFLVESLSPFEMTYRRFLDANDALRGINEVLEAEARRTARQIHDGAGQILFGLQLALADLARGLPPDRRQLVERSLELADLLDRQLRGLSRDLYPVSLDDLGLEPALRHLLNGVALRNGLVVEFRCSWQRRPSRAVESCFYRAVHEAVTNVVKHARASSVAVTLDRVETDLLCSVSDNGVGFSPAALAKGAGRGLGLIGIRERLEALGGTLDLRSAPGRGAHLIMSVPARAGECSDGHQSSDR